MNINAKVTEIFCLVDGFCKEYDTIVEKHIIGNLAKRHSITNKSDVTTIRVLFHLSGLRTFKHFYLFYAQKHMKSDFPRTVSYNRFTELMQHS